MDYVEYGYWGLFLVCFLSATIIPFSSEAALIYFAFTFDPVASLIVASVGNILGSLTNYIIGRSFDIKRAQRIFRKQSRYEYFTSKIEKYGYWLTAITWVPFIGDPLTILLGYFRVKFTPFLIILIVSKFLRYYILIEFSSGLFF